MVGNHMVTGSGATQERGDDALRAQFHGSREVNESSEKSTQLLFHTYWRPPLFSHATERHTQGHIYNLLIRVGFRLVADTQGT